MRQACHLKLLFSLVCFSSQVLSAESFIWSGGALDDDWSAASNWEGGVAPAQSGANSEGDLIFPSGPSDLNPFNDLPPPSISTPSFIADSVTIGDNYQIFGNGFQLGSPTALTNFISVTGNTASFLNDTIYQGANITVDVSAHSTLNIYSDITDFFTPTMLINNGSGVLVLLGFNDYVGGTQINNGQVYVDGIIAGTNPTVVVNPSGLLGGSGTVGNVINLGTVSPGDIGTIGTLSLSGTYFQGSNAALNVRIDGAGANDSLLIEGAATLSGTLNVDALPGGAYVIGETYTILNSIAGFNTQFTTVNVPPFVSVTYDPNHSIILTVIKQEILTGRHVHYHNPQQVLKYLQAIEHDPNSDLVTIIKNLVPLSTNALTKALDQMHPALFGAFELLNVNTSSMVASFLNRHMAEVTCDHCKGDCGLTNASVWLQPFGYFYDQDRIGEQVGFESNTEGVIVGFNYCFDNGIMLGTGGGYSNGYVRWKHHRGKGTVNSGYLGVYADYDYEPVYFELAAIGGINGYYSKRNIKFSAIDRHATNHHLGADFTGHLGGGGDIRLGAYYLKPYTNVDYLYLYQENFSEHGAKDLNLTVSARHTNMLRSEVGISISRSYETPAGCWMPTLFLSGINECYLRKRHYKSRFQDESLHFLVRTFSNPIYLISPGFDFTFMIDEGLSLSLRYSSELNTEIATQKGDVRFEWFF